MYCTTLVYNKTGNAHKNELDEKYEMPPIGLSNKPLLIVIDKPKSPLRRRAHLGYIKVRLAY